ncbi:unnamed protein product [Ascophyllum nodosum]
MWPIRWRHMVQILLLLLISLSGAAATATATVTGLGVLNQQRSLQSGNYVGRVEGEDAGSDQLLNVNFIKSTESSVCSDTWKSWPSDSARALESENIIVFRLFPAIGNLFLSLRRLIWVSNFLGVSMVLDSKIFPGFRQAFEPAQISWDIDPAPLKQRAVDIEKGRSNTSVLHAKTFSDGIIILSNAHFVLLTSILDIKADNMSDLIFMLQGSASTTMRNLISSLAGNLSRKANVGLNVEPCAWNMFFRMSPVLVDARRTYSPWPTIETDTLSTSFRSEEYVAWHLRIPTEADRRQGYNPNVHTYMMTETADVVCSLYIEAMESARLRCPTLFTNDTEVYISSISTSLGSSCIADLAEHGIKGVQVDMGLTADEAHTSHNGTNLESTINAFLDYMFLMDAKAIIRTGSSFSGTVTSNRGLTCRSAPNSSLSTRHLSMCWPIGFSC